MTKQARTEAEKYVERSLRAQEKLGYKRPKPRVVKAAVTQAAEAVDALMALRLDHKRAG